MGACLSYAYISAWPNEASLGGHVSGPRGCVVVCFSGIAGLSLDDLSRCAVAHLHYVNAGLQGIAATTVEVICL